MSTPPLPEPVNHTAELVIATIFGVMYGLKTGDYFSGIFIGIVAGVVYIGVLAIVRAPELSVATNQIKRFRRRSAE